jgi:hypothetical protein
MSLDDIVREAVMCNSSNEAACEFVMARLDDASTKEAIYRGVWTRVTEHRHNANRELKGKDVYIPKTSLQKRSKRAARLTSEFVAKSILDSMVIAGTALGDMTKERLNAWARHEELSIAGHEQNIAFADKIRALLPDDDTPVRDAVGEVTAREIFDECFKK